MNTKANNERKNCGYRYRPVLYFAMAYLFTWIFWVPAIFLDGNTAMILMLLGLISPAVVSTVFILVSGSPALKYASDGSDCGIYGGLYPYVDYGRPIYVPYFTNINVPAKATNGTLPISVTVEVQNK